MAESSLTLLKFKEIKEKLKLQQSTDRKVLQDELLELTVPKLKELCKHLKVKIGTANKAQLVGQLLSQWELGLLKDEDEEEHYVSALTPTVKQRPAVMPPFEVRYIFRTTSDQTGPIH